MLLHIAQKLIHVHLIVDRVFEPTAGIRDGAAETGTDHDQARRNGLRQADSRTGRQNRRVGAAHARPVIGREHHDALDDFRFLFRDQPLVP